MPLRDRSEGSAASLPAALHRVLPLLLTPLVLGAGLLASRGGSGGVWGVAFLLGVLAVALALVTAGVRGLRRDRRQSRRSTATTLPSTVASSPGMGS